jgi:hypothetical protein
VAVAVAVGAMAEGQVMRRVRLPLYSATTIEPSASRARPMGESRVAAEAGPPLPVDEAVPVPATVVMVPPRSTRRMRWLLVSVM